MDATLPSSAPSAPNPYGLRPGDVVGFSSRDCAGFWINAGTFGVPFWGLSHVAIVAEHPDWLKVESFDRGQAVLYESTTLYGKPCLVKGKRINGVQAHELVQRIEAYPGRVWRYPLAQPLDPFDRVELVNWLVGQLGKRYDLLGAWRARDLCLGRFRRWLLGRQNLRRLFCSELVAGGLVAAGAWHDDNASAWSPNRLCRELRRRGVVQAPIRLK